MERPRPIFSLVISILVSWPGVTLHEAGSVEVGSASLVVVVSVVVISEVVAVFVVVVVAVVEDDDNAVVVVVEWWWWVVDLVVDMLLDFGLVTLGLGGNSKITKITKNNDSVIFKIFL